MTVSPSMNAVRCIPQARFPAARRYLRIPLLRDGSRHVGQSSGKALESIISMVLLHSGTQILKSN